MTLKFMSWKRCTKIVQDALLSNHRTELAGQTKRCDASMMDRRTFVSCLVGAGLLPISPVVAATPQDLIDHLDRQLARKPLRFLVDDEGELALADWEPALDRFTAYDVVSEDLDPQGTRFADRLWQLEPLRVEVAEFLRDQHEAHTEADLNDDWDYDEKAVERLVRAADLPTLSALHQHLLAWFAEDLTSEECDGNDIVRPVDSKQWAFWIWGDLEGLNDAFNIEIVEGEHPGSSYYAARMGLSVEEANGVANQLGLPVTFLSTI